MRLYPPHILRIFVANRVRAGMTPCQVAAYIRREYKWHELDFGAMDEWDRKWWERMDGYLRELEGKVRQQE